MSHYGWKGKRLNVYLSENRAEVVPIDLDVLRSFIGGRGLNSRLLYHEIKPDIDPLGPDNILGFAVGPLNGTLAPTAGKMTISAKSPLTRILGDSNTGGFFCSEMKFAGYDQIVVYGKSELPVYLWIDDDRIQMRGASHIWGKDTWETDRLIKEELGDPDIQILAIGQGGANQVKFAGIVSNLTRIAARTGMGAVMGSKGLKAIAIRGRGNVEVASPSKFKEACLKAHAKIKRSGTYQLLHNFGTPFLLDHTNEVGRLSTRNCQQGWFEAMDKVGVEVLKKHYMGKNRGCASCPILCGHTYSIPVGEFMTRGDSAEYENIASFSAMIGNDDVEVALYASTLCDRYGLDTISTGYAVAFAMELWAKGFLSEKDTGGLTLGWGNRKTILSLLDQIANRSSEFGNLLAEGVHNVSKKFPGSERFAMVIKGNSCNVGDYRATKGGAFAHAVATRGADHLRGSPVIEYLGVTPEESERIFGKVLGKEKARSLVDYRAYFGKSSAVAWSENFMAVIDSAELCKAATIWASLEFMNPSDVAEMLNTCTGMEVSADELVRAGERIYNVEKAFNIREGMRRKDDTLPVRWFEEPQPAGPSRGEVVDRSKFQEMLDEYYEFRGWDTEGIPTAKKLKELGLHEIANNMERVRGTQHESK